MPTLKDGSQVPFFLLYGEDILQEIVVVYLALCVDDRFKFLWIARTCYYICIYLLGMVWGKLWRFPAAAELYKPRKQVVEVKHFICIFISFSERRRDNRFYSLIERGTSVRNCVRNIQRTHRSTHLFAAIELSSTKNLDSIYTKLCTAFDGQKYGPGYYLYPDDITETLGGANFYQDECGVWHMQDNPEKIVAKLADVSADAQSTDQYRRRADEQKK